MDETLSPSTLSQFTVVRQVGKGAFGRVFEVIRKSDGRPYAIKVVPLGRMDKQTCQNNLNEIRILCSVDHPNIVAYKEVFLDKNDSEMCIVMEFVGGGDLASKIADLRRRRMHLREESVWKYFLQALLGLRTLHQLKIIHRDVKPANLFLSEDYQLVKLGDLNVAKVAKDDLARTQIGTPLYLAPEVWANQLYTNKCDVFSLGCVVYEMAALRLPFEAANIAELCHKIRAAPIARIPPRYSDELYALIKWMLVKEPRARPSVDELLAHPLVARKMLEQHLQLYRHKETRDQLMNTIIMPHNPTQLRRILPRQKMYHREPHSAQHIRTESARSLPPEPRSEGPKQPSLRDLPASPASHKNPPEPSVAQRPVPESSSAQRKGPSSPAAQRKVPSSPGSFKNLPSTPRQSSKQRLAAEAKKPLPPKPKKLPAAINPFSKKAEEAPPAKKAEVKSRVELYQEQLERLAAPKRQLKRSNSEDKRPYARYY